LELQLGYRLDWGLIPSKGRGFISLPHCVQASFGVHPDFCPMGTGGSFARDKGAGA